MKRALKKMAVPVIALMLLSNFALPALAQQTITSATVTGRVQDRQGEFVSSAQVTLVNLERNQTWATTTDEEGRFRFPYLPVGEYQLKAEHTGFSMLDTRLTLTVGQSLELPLALDVATVSETVNITTDVPVIEAART
ncbi:MAG TPA: carboxypeptidase-like regulatory domain-containing protein, partial [Blastocatellia bacterium]|nr:carboxypeptidase-like regulatory domain-containing protein [Blastocatellia bacterium]